jgi:hypothetical protein
MGLATLELVDEVAMVAMPDIMPRPLIRERTKERPPRCDVIPDPSPDPSAAPAPVPVVPVAPPKNFGPDQIAALQNELIGHCERRRDRMAILDCLPDHRTPGEVLAWRSQELLASMFSALYYPWILVPDPLRLDGLVREVPPSGHVAGIWARVDRQTGVHKPPANETVEGATDLVVPTDDSQHGDLNTEGVNVIRAIPGRGLRVAGARTLSREPDWRYINVRRLINMIEEAIDEGTQFAVFEPNDRALWRQIDRSARRFLDDLWRRGALDGATAADAYFVRCDESTNPSGETDLGRITCVVGIQPPWPAEFVVVRIGRTETGTEVLEEVGAGRG